MSSVAAAAVVAARNRIVRRFVGAGALSVETARSLDELGVSRGLIVRRMIERGVLKEAPGGRLWLDEVANAESRRRARRYAAIAVGLGAVVVAMIVLLTK
ncbi:MAG: hypothetical protein ACOYN0_05325 [Phycisphaerales bacterium]